MYRDDMSKESKPRTRLPEGDRAVTVAAMVEKTSKQGNRMFVTTLWDNVTKDEMDVFLIAEQGKRWMLKQLLMAVGIKADTDGVVEWDVAAVIGKVVIAKVEHYQEPWINREGVEVMQDKAKVKSFVAHTGNPGNVGKPEDISWDE